MASLLPSCFKPRQVRYRAAGASSYRCVAGRRALRGYSRCEERSTVTYPDDRRIDDGDEEPGLDESTVGSVQAADANEADVIEQATAVPLDDDDGFDR